jgi:transposase
MSKKKPVKQRAERRLYDREFKEEAVQMVLDGHSAASVARNLGIKHASLIYRWKKEILGKEGKLATSLVVQAGELQQRLRQVERERDILKKALAIFSQKT